jgi:transposase
MKQYATEPRHRRVLVWVIWVLVVVAAMAAVGGPVEMEPSRPLLGVACHDGSRSGPLFPWQQNGRWRKWAWRKYCAWRSAYRRARRAAQLARFVLSGVLTMAQVVDWLTARQLRYQLGALPVLYAVLERLEVRRIINRHCPTAADVDHATVALVLVLNRLMLPLPLYQVADWVGQTVLVAVLGVPATKFNDDRLGRTLDALYPHLDQIWHEILDSVLTTMEIDLSVLFYDVSAFVAHGRYADSDLVDFGFAHNTPSNKRKLKLGLTVSADGNIPWLYRLWSGRTADQTTVAENLTNLATWLGKHGSPLAETLMVGDRAMLNAEIALAYEKHGLRHLTGLRAATAELKALVQCWTDDQFLAYPLVAGPTPNYWGRGCQVTLRHEGQSVTLKGLVVVSAPLRDQWRQDRYHQLDALEAELAQLRGRIGQPRLSSVKSVQRSVNARLRASPVARFLQTTVYETETGQVNLLWQRKAEELAQVERSDGRYLLVTNDWSLSHAEMFRLYRQKDGVETCFHIGKADLQISPLYLHQDERISAMLLLNMVALLVYNLLQRQIRNHGLQMTTRHLIQRLDSLTLIETHCWDGSSLRRLSAVDPQLIGLLHIVSTALVDFVNTVVPQPSLALPDDASAPAAQLLLC